jgi:hypothetical protein
VAQVKWHWQKKAAKEQISKVKKLRKALDLLEEDKTEAKQPLQTLGEYLRSVREDGAAQQIGPAEEKTGVWWLDGVKREQGVAQETGWDKFGAGHEAKDMVNSPAHYTHGGIETIDFIEAKQLGYHLGNVVKYVSRAPHKGRHIEDLKKARWYLDREIERVEADV